MSLLTITFVPFRLTKAIPLDSMYTTFATNSSRQRRGVAVAASTCTAKRLSKNDGATLDHDSPTNTTSNSSETRRPKRSQVARACESCRINRIKCDDFQPCNACRNRGEECSNIGRPGLLTLPTATKQVTY